MNLFQSSSQTTAVRRFHRDASGATGLEYALFVGIFGLGLLAASSIYGDEIKTTGHQVAVALSDEPDRPSNMGRMQDGGEP